MKKRYVLSVLATLCISGFVMAGCGAAEETEVVESEVETAVVEDVEETIEVEDVEEETTSESGEDASDEDEEPVDEPEDPEEPEETEEDVTRLSPTEIYADIQESVTLNAPMELDSGFIMNLFGIDVSQLDGYVISISESATSAETIVLLDAKDGADVDGMLAMVQGYVTNKGFEMDNYLPDQYSLVEKAAVAVDGDFVYAIISENQSAILDVLKNDGVE